MVLLVVLLIVHTLDSWSYSWSYLWSTHCTRQTVLATLYSRSYCIHCPHVVLLMGPACGLPHAAYSTRCPHVVLLMWSYSCCPTHGPHTVLMVLLMVLLIVHTLSSCGPTHVVLLMVHTLHSLSTHCPHVVLLTWSYSSSTHCTLGPHTVLPHGPTHGPTHCTHGLSRGPTHRPTHCTHGLSRGPTHGSHTGLMVLLMVLLIVHTLYSPHCTHGPTAHTVLMWSYSWVLHVVHPMRPTPHAVLMWSYSCGPTHVVLLMVHTLSSCGPTHGSYSWSTRCPHRPHSVLMILHTALMAHVYGWPELAMCAL